MSMVHASRGRLIPASDQLRSEIVIVTELAYTLFGDDIGWREMGRDYRIIRKHTSSMSCPASTPTRNG